MNSRTGRGKVKLLSRNGARILYSVLGLLLIVLGVLGATGVIDGKNGGMNINAYFALSGEIELPFIATKFGFALQLCLLTASGSCDDDAQGLPCGIFTGSTI